MYYVIKQQHNQTMDHFIGFVVVKYIISKNNDNVIFEFLKNGKTDRKWVNKDDIILLTKDKDYFLETLNHFKATQNQQLDLVNQAKEQLELSMQHLDEVMHEEIDKYHKLKLTDGIPCIIKEYKK